MNENDCADANGWTPLHLVCREGNVSKLAEVVTDNNINAKTSGNNTPVHVAALYGNDEVALRLITQYHCDVTVPGYMNRSLLHSACIGGDAYLVMTLILEHGADIAARDDSNDTPLHVAALWNNDKVVKLLIEKFHGNITTKGCHGRSLLHSACNGGGSHLVQTLLLHGADATARDDQNNTPLHVAALCGRYDVARCLMAYFPNDKTIRGCQGRSLLHSACNGGCSNLVGLLILWHHADVMARDDENNTPLHVAALCGKKEVVELLITNFKCDINVKGYLGRTPLHSACKNGYANLARTLIKLRADINVRDEENNTPLHVAIHHGQNEVVSVLVEEIKYPLHWACQNGYDNLVQTLIHEQNVGISKNNDNNTTVRDDKNNTPLHVAALCGQEKVVSILIKDFHMDIEDKGFIGRSPLHCACKNGSVSLVRALILEHKADTAARDDENNTPLHVAALCGQEEVVSTLIKEFHMHIEDKGCFGRSPLHCACKNGSVSLVRALILEHKADTAARDDKNSTPLHVAALCGQKEVLSILIKEFHVDIEDKDSFGRSPLHCACENESVSLVRADILEHNTADKNNTPLHVAALCGQEEVVSTLIKEFHMNIEDKDRFGRSPLHCACKNGSVSLVQALILEHKADTAARDDKNSTPLHTAVLHGQDEVVSVLVKEFNCDIEHKGYYSRYPLHWACQNGYGNLVQTLLRKQKVDNFKDDDNNTPLHVTTLNGHHNIAPLLFKEFHKNIEDKGCLGRSPLHCACKNGSISLVRALILEHKADTSARDDENNTPLHVAASCGQEEVASTLIKDFQMDIEDKGFIGRSPLHCACKNGSVSLVQTLILEHKADTAARDDENNTPLHVAALCSQEEVVSTLIKEFHMNIEDKGCFGRSPLHCACKNGRSISLVQTLILEHKADIAARDDENNTPLHVAALCSQEEVVSTLIKEFHMNIEDKGCFGRSPLHCACKNGSVSLVRALILEHKADTAARDDENNTPLHVAALCSQEEVVSTLIKEFYMNIEDKGCFGRSPLHCACKNGSVSLVQALILEHKADTAARDDENNTPLHVAAMHDSDEVILLLIKEFSVSLLNANSNGNTALHLCSQRGYNKSLHAMLASNPPVLLRNNAGLTPGDIAAVQSKSLLDEYMKKNKEKIYVHYDVLQRHARRKYSSAERITRIFVIGNPGAGKSTLIQNLKREHFFNFWRLSESSVPPHTAGIIPSIHNSKYYGRTLFYDFAGDAEYYSSHAAILENLAPLNIGDNIFIIVVDLRENNKSIVKSIHFWLTLIHSQKMLQKPSLIIIGSHLDLITKEELNEKRKLILSVSENDYEGFHTVNFTLLDCCKARGVGDVQTYIMDITKHSPHYSLSTDASILLGLLEKDFSNVITCSIKAIVSHIEDTNVHLPTTNLALSRILDELHNIGLLLALKGKNKSEIVVVLSISDLINDVHRHLFSSDAQLKIGSNIGILSEDAIQSILPTFVTKECLIHLQYCQDIRYKDLGTFPSVCATSTSPDQTFLFFPALCSMDKNDVSWATPNCFNYSIGWLAKCTDPHDYFPPRFLHVLLLRLVFRFTLSADPTCNDDFSEQSDFKRRCTMWKTGVHWLMQEGVECLVELVDINRVVIITKSEEDLLENCVSVFNRVVSCVMEAKAEFCHSIRPQFFLLDSTESDELYLSESNLFSVNEVEEVLQFSDGKEAIVSLDGKRLLRRNKISSLRKLTHWDSVFPLDFSLVLCHLKDVVKELLELGLQLGIPPSILEGIELKFPTDFDRTRRELVRQWLSSSQNPPCWWHLVEALRKVERGDIANAIERKYVRDIQLEKSLLTAKQSIKPDEEFLEAFASVVESKWPALASVLSLTSAEIEEVRRKGEELSQRDFALQMLRQWVAREDATYGQLCQRLKTISLFQYGK